MANTNMQDISDKCVQKFMTKAKEKMGDTSHIPSTTISKYCRMLAIYCDSEGKVTPSFVTAMNKCVDEIIAIEGLEEILNACNECS